MRVYRYKCLFVHRYFEDIAINYGLRESIDIDDSTFLQISIDSTASGDLVIVSNFDTKEELLRFTDNGETKTFLKGVGKYNTAAYIASCIKENQEFLITDLRGNEYGITKKKILGNTYIITGGYNNPTSFLNINGVEPKMITEIVLQTLLRDHQEMQMFSIRRMTIKIAKVIASSADINILTKPYVIITDL